MDEVTVNDAASARELVAAWEGHGARDTYLRLALESQEGLVGFCLAMGRPQDAEGHRAAARELRRALT